MFIGMLSGLAASRCGSNWVINAFNQCSQSRAASVVVVSTFVRERKGLNVPVRKVLKCYLRVRAYRKGRDSRDAAFDPEKHRLVQIVRNTIYPVRRSQSVIGLSDFTSSL